MIVDIGSIMFNMEIAKGGGTPSWGTDLGQSKDHKFLDKVYNIMIGMVYKSVSNIKDVYCPLGKGGSRQDDYEYVLAGKFDKVYINNIRVEGAEFVLLIVKKLVGDYHVGRRTIKYSPKITYQGAAINENCYIKMKKTLGLNDTSAWFIFDLDVKNQDELHFSAIIVDKDTNMVFEDAEQRKNYVKAKIKECGVDIDDNESTNTIESLIIEKYRSLDFSQMEQELSKLYEEFQYLFGPEKLEKLEDKELLGYMFLSENYNQTNMCWNLEFNPKLKNYFGAVGGGTAYTYGLHYSKKHNSWVTGPGNKPIILTNEEAIQKAKEIRKMLVDAVAIVKKYENSNEVSTYAELHSELEELCGSESNKLWFKKYLHMLFPQMFSTFYNYDWLTFLNRKCGFEKHDDLYEISGELSSLAKRVNLPNAVVSKVLFELFGYPNQEKKEELDNENEEENTKMVDRKPRINRNNPLNSIIYGAPGTGKTYSTAEYAVAFVEGRKPNLAQMTTSERELLMKKYRELTQSGQVVFTTFHQSYGYEEFIQGLRPDTKDGEMRFVPADGVFKKIADKAMQDQENNYVIIIDEINRGNISKVFGELITLIEEDKRWGEINQLSVMLPSGQEFAVPNNLYIVGTMNSADKSIALIDTALRRRFEFIEVAPNEDLIKDTTLKNVLVQLNAVLRKQLESSDLLIGHAYFIGKNKDDLANILNRNIIPLLYEYFYDNEKKVKDALAKAIEGTDVKINETINGRIRVE